MAAAADDDDEAVWQGLGWGALAQIEDSCRCGICQEFFDTPVSLGDCGHTFCSVCIRRNLEYQQRSNRALDNSATCPVCRGPASTRSMKLNINLRNIVSAFTEVRPRLLQALRDHHGGTGTGTAKPLAAQESPGAAAAAGGRTNAGEGRATPAATETSDFQSRRRSRRNSSRFSGGSPSNGRGIAPAGRRGSAAETIVVESGSELEEREREEGGVSAAREAPIEASAPATQGWVPAVNIPKGRQQCPICGILVSEALMSGHLDVCLEKQERQERRASQGVRPVSTGGVASSFLMAPPASRGGQTHAGRNGFGNNRKTHQGSQLPNKLEPKKLPKLVFHIMKDKELKKYLQQYSLPCGGDRKMQVDRLKEFTHQYNARIDSGVPSSYREVAAVVLEGERIKARAKAAESSASKAVDVQAEEDLFQKLISDTRKRMRGGQAAEGKGAEAAGAEADVEREGEEEAAKEQRQGPGAGVSVSMVPESFPENDAVAFRIPETIDNDMLATPASSAEVQDSQSDDDFVIPSQMHRSKLRRSSRGSARRFSQYSQ